MKSRFFYMLFSVLILSTTLFAADAAVKYQTNCPVCNDPIKTDLSVAHEGKVIFLGCEGCVEPVQTDAEKYIQQIETEGITLAKIQTRCPMMGGKVNKDLYADHSGKRVYFCCTSGCEEDFLKNPAKVIKEQEAKGVFFERVAEGKTVSPGNHSHGTLHKH